VQIQINTDNTIDGNQDLKVQILEIVEQHLSRFGERLTRVEVHLSDLNGAKGGRDTRCVMEGRIAGMNPFTVDDVAEDWGRAVRNASAKLERALDSRIGRKSGH